jgi:cell wall surface anchor family protein
MRKKNLSVKVAALAMSGTLAMAPMTVRADEVAGTTETAAPATSTTEESAAAGASTESTAPTTTAVEAAGTAATTAAPVTVVEPAADPGTTAPNNVNNVVKDDKQGTDISASFLFWGGTTKVTPNDVKEGKKLGQVSGDLNGTSFGEMSSGDVVLKGDLSIKKDESTENYDSTSSSSHEVNKEDSYSLKADLDVSAVTKSINASKVFVEDAVGTNPNDSFVNNLQTGLRATFVMGDNLNGEFYRPRNLQDAKEHYALSSSDGNPMIYRINYSNSSFDKNKVVLAMDLDLTNMHQLDNKYLSPKTDRNMYLYGKKTNGDPNVIENFNHTVTDERGNKKVNYDTPGIHEYQTSVFGNLQELVNQSAQKIQLIMKGIKLNSASGNRTESAPTTTATATETVTEKTITTEGSIKGTLVGYMTSNVGAGRKIPVSYKWGAIQNDAGRDKVAGQDNDKVYLTVKFTDKERTVTPIAPVNPVQPVNPGNGGNGGNGGGDRTPIIPTVTPVVTPNENTPADPGQVLGVDRPVSVDNAVSVEEKKGEVLGATRPSTKAVATRATVSTGDNNYSALWASLFGLSLASLAGFVVLRKKEQI